VSFDRTLKEGLIGEGEISRMLIARGYIVLPAYQIEQQHGKGPRLFTAEGQLIAPDMLVFKENKVIWVEAKTKSAFTWHRASQTWQTGIDRKHWSHYVEVDSKTPWPVWLLFLHRNGFIAKDTPDGMISPSGLFGNSVRVLKLSIHHEHENHGPSGMVYWTVDMLKKINL
jgi:hypothetical protein